MKETLGNQISLVRSQISTVFSNPGSPVSIPLSLGLPKFSKSPNSRTMKKLPRYQKPKEYLSLPNISVHRNPMSFVSERDVGRQMTLTRKKNISKGLTVFNIPASTAENENDWYKVIKTCSELIKNKCAGGL